MYSYNFEILIKATHLGVKRRRCQKIRKRAFVPLSFVQYRYNRSLSHWLGLWRDSVVVLRQIIRIMITSRTVRFTIVVTVVVVGSDVLSWGRLSGKAGVAGWLWYAWNDSGSIGLCVVNVVALMRMSLLVTGTVSSNDDRLFGVRGVIQPGLIGFAVKLFLQIVNLMTSRPKIA